MEAIMSENIEQKYRKITDLIAIFESDFKRFKYIVKNEALDELIEEEEEENDDFVSCCEDKGCKNETNHEEEDDDEYEEEEEEEGECDSSEYALHFLAFRMFSVFQSIVELLFINKNSNFKEILDFEIIFEFLKKEKILKNEEEERAILILSTFYYESINGIMFDEKNNLHSNDNKMEMLLPLAVLIVSIENLFKIVQKIKA
jgi:hypothetical protein